MKPRGYKHRRDNQQLSFHTIGFYFSTLLQSTFSFSLFAHDHFFGNESVPLIIFSKGEDGEFSLFSPCNHKGYSSFINCCLNPGAVKAWGGSGMEGSPLCNHTLLFLDGSGREEGLTLLPLLSMHLILGGAL